MSHFHEFKEAIPVSTPLGSGYALFIEYRIHDYYWTVVFKNGGFVTFQQKEIRAARSYTYGRGINNEQMREIIRGYKP